MLNKIISSNKDMRQFRTLSCEAADYKHFLTELQQYTRPILSIDVQDVSATIVAICNEINEILGLAGCRFSNMNKCAELHLPFSKVDIIVAHKREKTGTALLREIIKQAKCKGATTFIISNVILDAYPFYMNTLATLRTEKVLSGFQYDFYLSMFIISLE